MQIIKYRFEIHGDERGQLVAIEQLKDIPFKIERVYYLYETRDGVRRGFHAHKELEQILVCVHGSCKILLDDGSNKRDVVLNKPNEGLYIPNSIWREMYDFSSDAVLLVLASNLYNENDYIRNYDEFISYINESE